MKQFALIVVFFAAASLIGGTAFADDGARRAGILPTSVFSWADRAEESVEGVLSWALSFIYPSERAAFYHELLEERSAEAKAVGKAQGFLSEEYRAATGRYLDAAYAHILTENQLYRDPASREERYQTFQRLQEDLGKEHLEEYRKEATEEMIRLDELKFSLRKEVAEKARAGDPLVVERALANLARARVAEERLFQQINNGSYLLDVQRIYEDKLQFSADQAALARSSETSNVESVIQKYRRESVERFLQTRLSDEAFLTKSYVPRKGEGWLDIFDEFKTFDAKVQALRDLLRDGLTDEEMARVVSLEKEIDEELERAAEMVGERARRIEEAAKPKAEKDAEKDAVAKKIKRGQPGFWPLFPRLRPLGIPDPVKLGGPVIFTPPRTQFTATVGVPFSYSFCQPPVAGKAALCGASSTVPKGGKPPYHFLLETGVGFPPFGMQLNLNGLLAGTPKAAGSRIFGVCAADLAGRYACKNVTVVVMDKPKDLSGECGVMDRECRNSCATKPIGPPAYEREQCLANCDWRYDICKYNEAQIKAYYDQQRQQQMTPPPPTTPSTPPPISPPTLNSCLEVALRACRKVYLDSTSSQQAKDAAYAICTQLARANCN